MSHKADKHNLEQLIEERFNEKFSFPEDIKPTNELINILSHRSYRVFSDKIVKLDILQFLYYCAFSAPSKSDLQQADIIHIQNADLRHRIESLIPSMPWIGDAPALLVFCGNNRRIHQICERQHKKYANDHVDSFMNAATDTSIVLMNFIRAAEAIGLVCCPISAVRNEIDKVSELLKLPKLVFPFCGLVLGYPSPRREIFPRLTTRLTVHTDTFEDNNIEPYLDGYDDYRRSRGDFPKQRYTKDYGLTKNYSWSEDKARQYSKPERQQLGQYLIKQGFVLDK